MTLAPGTRQDHSPRHLCEVPGRLCQGDCTCLQAICRSRHISRRKFPDTLHCWKSFFWIHALLLIQLKYLFYYKNQVKILGKTNVNLRLNEQGTASETITIPDTSEHDCKWKKMDKTIKR